MRIRERCPCGGDIDVKGDDSAELAGALVQWRDTHPCPARQRAPEREVAAGSSTEQSYAPPHRLDAELHRPPRPPGFVPPPAPRGPVD